MPLSLSAPSTQNITAVSPKKSLNSLDANAELAFKMLGAEGGEVWGRIHVWRVLRAVQPYTIHATPSIPVTTSVVQATWEPRGSHVVLKSLCGSHMSAGWQCGEPTRSRFSCASFPHMERVFRDSTTQYCTGLCWETVWLPAGLNNTGHHLTNHITLTNHTTLRTLCICTKLRTVESRVTHRQILST